MLDWLKGKKTYLVAAAFALVAFLESAGMIETAMAEKAREVLIGLGAMTFRAAIAKGGNGA